MDLHAVRVAVAEAASAVVCDPPLTCFPYVPAEGPTPFLYVQVEGVQFDKTFNRGLDYIDLTLMVMHTIADDEHSQRFIDDLLYGDGPGSLKTAMEAARGEPGQAALGGLADDVYVSGTDSAPRWFDWSDGKKYYGVGLKCRVIGSGD